MMVRMPWWGKSGACALLVLLALGAAVAWSSNEAQATDYRATVIYFYPNDYQPDQGYIDQIDPSVADVQQWYGAQVGKTFAVNPTVVVKGDHDSSWYKCSPNYCDWAAVWYNVLGELYGKGYPYCQDHMLLIFLGSSIPFQGGGGCDAAYTASNGGVAMFTQPQTDRGVIAHELGHALTLPHPKNCSTTWPDYCSQTVMWAWWHYPNVGLLNLEVAPEKGTLANSPFFTTTVESGALDDQPVDGEPVADEPVDSQPDTVSPTVKIVSPSDGAVVRGRWLRVRAEATDNVAVTKMELYIDSQLVFTTEAASLKYKWDMREMANGSSITVTVKALDGAGNSSVTEVSVSK